MKKHLALSLIFTSVWLSSPTLAAPPASTPALIEKGKASFATNCIACHGEKADDNSPAAAYMNPKPRNLIKDKFKQGDQPQKIFKTITEGLPNSTMTSYKHISEEERWGISYYISSLRKSQK